MVGAPKSVEEAVAILEEGVRNGDAAFLQKLSSPVTDAMKSLLSSIEEQPTRLWISYLIFAMETRIIKQTPSDLHNSTGLLGTLTSVATQMNPIVSSLRSILFIEAAISGSANRIFESLESYNVFEEIAQHLKTLDSLGFEAAHISVKLLDVLDRLLISISPEILNVSSISHISLLLSEICRSPEAAEIFIASCALPGLKPQTSETDDFSSGLSLVFTGAYQLFPLFPLPFVYILSSISFATFNGAIASFTLFDGMTYLAVELDESCDSSQFLMAVDASNFVVTREWQPYENLALPVGTRGEIIYSDGGRRILFQHRYSAFAWFSALIDSIGTSGEGTATTWCLIEAVAKMFIGFSNCTISGDDDFRDDAARRLVETGLDFVLGPFSRLSSNLLCISSSTANLPNEKAEGFAKVTISALQVMSSLAKHFPDEIVAALDSKWLPILFHGNLVDGKGLYCQLHTGYELRSGDFSLTLVLCQLFGGIIGSYQISSLVISVENFIVHCLLATSSLRFAGSLRQRLTALREVYALTARMLTVAPSTAIAEALIQHISRLYPTRVTELAVTVISLKGPSFLPHHVVEAASALLITMMACLVRLFETVTNAPCAFDENDASEMVLAGLQATKAVATSNCHRLYFEMMTKLISGPCRITLSPSDRVQLQTLTFESAADKDVAASTAAMDFLEATVKRPCQFSLFGGSGEALTKLNSMLVEYLPKNCPAAFRILAAGWRRQQRSDFISAFGSESVFWETVFNSLKNTDDPALITAVFDLISLELLELISSPQINQSQRSASTPFIVHLGAMVTEGRLFSRLDILVNVITSPSTSSDLMDKSLRSLSRFLTTFASSIFGSQIDADDENKTGIAIEYEQRADLMELVLCAAINSASIEKEEAVVALLKCIILLLNRWLRDLPVQEFDEIGFIRRFMEELLPKTEKLGPAVTEVTLHIVAELLLSLGNIEKGLYWKPYVSHLCHLFDHTLLPILVQWIRCDPSPVCQPLCCLVVIKTGLLACPAISDAFFCRITNANFAVSLVEKTAILIGGEDTEIISESLSIINLCVQRHSSSSSAIDESVSANFLSNFKILNSLLSAPSYIVSACDLLSSTLLKSTSFSHYETNLDNFIGVYANAIISSVAQVMSSKFSIAAAWIRLLEVVVTRIAKERHDIPHSASALAGAFFVAAFSYLQESNDNTRETLQACISIVNTLLCLGPRLADDVKGFKVYDPILIPNMALVPLRRAIQDLHQVQLSYGLIFSAFGAASRRIRRASSSGGVLGAADLSVMTGEGDSRLSILLLYELLELVFTQALQHFTHMSPGLGGDSFRDELMPELTSAFNRFRKLSASENSRGVEVVDAQSCRRLADAYESLATLFAQRYAH